MKCPHCGFNTIIMVGQYYTASDELSMLCQVQPSMVCMITIKGADVGNRWNDPVSVKSSKNISFEEFNEICGGQPSRFTLIDSPF